MDSNSSYSYHRRLGCVSLLVAIFALYQTLYAVRVLQQRELFENWFSGGITLQVVSAVVWTSAFFACLVGLWLRWQWANRAAIPLLIGFILFRAGRYALFAQADYDRQRLLFIIGLSVMIIALPSFILLRQRRET